MPLFDEKQLLADIQNNKITALDLSHCYLLDEKAEAKNTATLSEHSDSVRALTVLPDGRVASGSYDNTIKLWDVKSGTCVTTLSGHRNTVDALTVLPDGRLASCSHDKTIKLWDVKSGTCIATLSGHSSRVIALTVLPDGRLVSGSSDKTIKLWGVKSGICVASLSGHSDGVYALTVLPDGRLASCSYDNTIKLWDVKRGACVATLKGHSNTVYALTVLPDGRLASSSYDKTIKLWDLKSGACVATLSNRGSFNALTVLPDGRLASCSSDKTTKLWDVKSGACVETLSGHSDGVLALTVLPDGRLVSGSHDKTLKLWDCGLRPLSWPAMQGVLKQLVNNSSVRQVNLQHTALSDASIKELAAIFQSNQTVAELNLSKTEVTAQGAEIFYKSLPLHHPLRQGLRHEAVLNIFCNDVLTNFFSYSLIKLMMDFLSEEDRVQSRANIVEQQNNAVDKLPAPEKKIDNTNRKDNTSSNPSEQPQKVLFHPPTANKELTQPSQSPLMMQTPQLFFNTSSSTVPMSFDFNVGSNTSTNPAKK